MRLRFGYFRNRISPFLSTIERIGNALPHPATLFALFAVAIVLFSWIATQSGIRAAHPGTGPAIEPVSLLRIAGLHRLLTQMVTNYPSFPPLGTALEAMLGIGVMEASGLIAAGMRLLVLSAPQKLLTFVIVFAGVTSNMASEIGYLLLVPLGRDDFSRSGPQPDCQAGGVSRVRDAPAGPLDGL